MQYAVVGIFGEKIGGCIEIVFCVDDNLLDIRTPFFIFLNLVI